MKTIGEVLDGLFNENLITEDKTRFKNQTESESPWFIQGLTGIGGWIAAIFFFASNILCLTLTFSMASNQGIGAFLSVLGIIFIFGTTIHSLNQTASSLFVQQFRLAIHIGGHLAFITGITLLFELWNSEHFVIMLSIIMIVQAVIGIVFYQDTIFRFIASLVIVLALNLIVYDFGIAGSLSLLIAVLAFCLLYSFGGFIAPELELRYFDILQVLPYGLTFGLFATILHEISYGYQIFSYDSALYQPYLSSVILLLFLVWLIIRLLNDYEIPVAHRFTWAVLGLVLVIGLCTLNTPGILAGILVILLAYRRRNRILLGIAYLFLAYFISYFYYSLSFTLLVKSIILIATGLVFLMGRFLLRHFAVTPEGGAS